MPTGTIGDDVFNAGGGREAFNGDAGTDTVSYAASAVGVDANLAAGQATLLARVMPLGDSITYGMVSYADVESGGYRPKLWDRLGRDGLAIDYVGSQTSGPSTLPDRNHQGMSGRTIDYLDRYDASWLAAAAPDVVMLMAGTNDTARDTPARMIAEMRALITSITDNRPGVTLLVASIPPTHDAARQAKVEAYNAALPGLVAELAQTRNVRFVDMGDLTRADITAPPADNGLHPTDGGYEKIAANWHEALLASGVFENERDALSGIENLVGTALRDRLTGDDGANALSGLGGNDDLHGGGGADRLDGGAGADLMAGGAGDDLYLVDSSSDRVVEAAGEGGDTVHATVSYALSAGSAAETLAFVGSGSATLTGNEVGNRVQGAAGSDKLFGGAGDDVLLGGAGNDTLDGGAGGDALHGGSGSDTYVVDSAADVVSEANPVTGADETGGDDTVKASVSYELGAFVEHLTLTGADAVQGTGNALRNRINGSAADNFLFGGGERDTIYGAAGDDAIDGGTGNDTLGGGTGADTLMGGDGIDTLYGDAGDDALWGGTGADRFTFNAAPIAANGVDRVEDFVGGHDRLAFEDAVFAGLQARDSGGRIRADQFRLGAAADADDFLGYDQETGRVFYDQDGSGAAERVLMATLDAGQALTANDLYVV